MHLILQTALYIIIALYKHIEAFKRELLLYSEQMYFLSSAGYWDVN